MEAFNSPKTANKFLVRPGAFFKWLWIVCALGSLFFMLDAIGHRYQQLLVSGPDAVSNTGQLHVEQVEALGDLGISLQFYAGYFTTLELIFGLAAFTIAIVIFWKRADDWLPWLLSLGLATIVLFGSPLTSAADRTHPSIFPFLLGLRTVGLGSFVISFLIFPDGKFVPKKVIWLSVLWVIYLLISLLVPALRFRSNILWEKPGELAVLILFLFYLVAIAWVQLIRYRNYATPTQRQQTKWVVYGVGLGFVLSAASSLPFVFIPFFDLPLAAEMLARMISFTLILVSGLVFSSAFAPAILYARLWDIDIIIRRTLQYAILSAVLAVVFFGGVVLLQNLFRSLPGDPDSPLVTVLSTLAIAALFNPLRTRIQDFIDRRFYRQKYDAEQALAYFAAAARDEVDLENLAASMLGTVDESLKPERISLWLQRSKRS